MIKIKKHTEYTCELRLYIGSREGYHGREFNEEELIEAVGAFQSSYTDFTPVRVTKTRYVDRTYNEYGWELAIICFPRQPRTKAQLHRFITDLAAYLLEELKQNRVTVVTDKYTTMFEVEKK
jgi:hypothetical protein